MSILDVIKREFVGKYIVLEDAKTYNKEIINVSLEDGNFELEFDDGSFYLLKPEQKYGLRYIPVSTDGVLRQFLKGRKVRFSERWFGARNGESIEGKVLDIIEDISAPRIYYKVWLELTDGTVGTWDIGI